DVTVRLDKEKDLAAMLATAIESLPTHVMTQSQTAIEASIARHQSMSDALRIALSGQESGAIKLENDGTLQQVIEREPREGDYELAKRTLSPSSPWSDQLYQNSSGHWYKLEAAVGADGKPLKMMNGDKPTSRNVYTRTV